MREVIKERASALFSVTTLGRGEVCVCGQPVTDKAFKTQKVKLLLVLLVLSHGKDLNEDDLIEALWPDTGLAGRRSLNTALCLLRKAVGPQAAWAIERERGFLRIRRDATVWCDTPVFETRMRQASAMRERGDGSGAMRVLQEASMLYRGRYLDGCYLEWAVRKRETLELMATTALTELATYALEAGNPESALEHATRATEIDPYDEGAHQLVMRAHTRLGRPDRAIRQFERCQRRFRDDLSQELSIALIEECLRARIGSTATSPIVSSSPRWQRRTSLPQSA